LKNHDIGIGKNKEKKEKKEREKNEKYKYTESSKETRTRGVQFLKCLERDIFLVKVHIENGFKRPRRWKSG